MDQMVSFNDHSLENNADPAASNNLFDWAVGIFSRFFPLKNPDDSKTENISMPNQTESNCSEPRNPFPQDSNETSQDDEVFEEELTSTLPETQSNNEPRPYLHSRRIKSSELLKPPSTKQTSGRFKRQERSKSIKFDTVAVWLDAADEGDLDEIKRLLETVDIDLCNEKGATALHRAAGYGQIEVVKELISCHANVNAVDIDGWTPLHYAVSAGALEVVQILIEAGGNIEAKTDIGDMAADLTEVPEILNLLRGASHSKYHDSSVTAMYDFKPQMQNEMKGDELAFKEGDVIKIIDRDDPEWWLAELDDLQGYVPRNFVQ